MQIENAFLIVTNLLQAVEVVSSARVTKLASSGKAIPEPFRNIVSFIIFFFTVSC